MPIRGAALKRRQHRCDVVQFDSHGVTPLVACPNLDSFQILTDSRVVLHRTRVVAADTHPCLPTSWSLARLTAQFGLCSPGLHANRCNRALVGVAVAQMWRRRWCLSRRVPRRLSWPALRCAAGHPTWGASLTPIGDPAQPHGIRLSVRCRPEPRARVVSGWPSGGVSDPRGTPRRADR